MIWRTPLTTIQPIVKGIRGIPIASQPPVRRCGLRPASQGETLMSQACRFAVVLAIAFGCAAPAHAQQGARISGFYAGAFGEGDTNTAAGGSVGYRFTPRFGFEFEALALAGFRNRRLRSSRRRRGVSLELRGRVSEPRAMAHTVRAGRRRSRQHPALGRVLFRGWRWTPYTGANPKQTWSVSSDP